MTYKEAYLQCNTKEELEKMVSHDISYAEITNKDRVSIIVQACKEVASGKWDGWYPKIEK